MVVHAFLMVCIAAPVITLLVALAVCAARTVEIRGRDSFIGVQHV